MCRFTLYLGPAIRMSALVTEPRNSLIRQSFESQEREEPLNGDGFGVAWYAHELEREPALFRSITPAWNNANLQSIARVVKSHCILAHVRAATQVRSVSEANCHPFVHAQYSFMHNGDLAGFSALRRELLALLSDEAFEAIRGSTDSEHLFALLVDELRRRESLPPLERMAASLEATMARALELSGRRAGGAPSYLNLALSDGQCAVVTRFTSEPDYAGESLHLHRGRRYVCEAGVCRMVPPEKNAAGAVIVASERLSDDPGWELVPRNHMVLIAPTREVELRPLVHVA
ncbi:MAG: class II glutamine amidotransferase [Planctomycetes bacterium]|nr:class II glutamine amidotransferase [Planctomycetota bacterium]